MINLKQKELLDWQNRNFTNEKLEEMSHGELIQMIKLLQVALGICEEAGEVAHHILKGTQNIRGGVNGVNKEEVADGIADGLIYGVQAMSALELDAETEISEVIETVLARDWKVNPNNGMKVRVDEGYTDIPELEVNVKFEKDLFMPNEHTADVNSHIMEYLDCNCQDKSRTYNYQNKLWCFRCHGLVSKN